MEGPLPHPPRTSGLDIPPPHPQHHTDIHALELRSPPSEAHFPREAMPARLSAGRRAATVPSAPVLSSLPGSPRPQKRTDRPAPALIGSWCCSSSLFFLLGCDGKNKKPWEGTPVF